MEAAAAAEAAVSEAATAAEAAAHHLGQTLRDSVLKQSHVAANKSHTILP